MQLTIETKNEFKAVMDQQNQYLERIAIAAEVKAEGAKKQTTLLQNIYNTLNVIYIYNVIFLYVCYLIFMSFYRN